MKSWPISGGRRLKFLLLAGDLVLLVVAGVGTLGTRSVLAGRGFPELAAGIGIAPVMVLLGLYLLVFYIFNLYSLDVIREGSRTGIFVALAVLFAVSASAAALYFLSPRSVILGRTILVFHAGFSATLVFLWRLVFSARVLSKWPVLRIGILADPKEFDLLAEKLGKSDSPPMFVVGDFRGGNPSPADPSCSGARGLSDFGADEAGRSAIAPETPAEQGRAGLLEAAKENNLDMVVCSARRETPVHFIREAIDLRCNGFEVRDFPSFYGSYFGKVPLEAIDSFWILQAIRRRTSRAAERMRRLTDILGGFVLLVLSLPLMAAISIASKLTSRGPVLFVQERLGRDERPFQCFKFRTMVTDAEAESGPRWATENDSRVTPFGGFLRKTRLDELPQLINVLRGDMSLVGFRPIRKHFADILKEQIPFYRLRFSTKPGLTGWPQVRHDYAGTEDGQKEKFEYELFYLANRSLLLDAYILVKTVQVVLFGRGQ